MTVHPVTSVFAAIWQVARLFGHYGFPAFVSAYNSLMEGVGYSIVCIGCFVLKQLLQEAIWVECRWEISLA